MMCFWRRGLWSMRLLPLILGCTEPTCSEFVSQCSHTQLWVELAKSQPIMSEAIPALWGGAIRLCYPTAGHFTFFCIAEGVEKCRVAFLFCAFIFTMAKWTREPCSKHLLMQLESSYTRGCCLWLVLLMKNLCCNQLLGYWALQPRKFM